MKTIMLAVWVGILVGIGPAGVMADSGQTPATGATLQMLTDQLGLSKDQQGQVGPILETEQKERRAVTTSKSVKPMMRQTQLAMVHQYALQQLKGVLSPAQFGQLMQRADYSAAWPAHP